MTDISKMTDIERCELHCCICDKYVQFDVNLGLNGAHILLCPWCGHRHGRMVINNKMTALRRCSVIYSEEYHVNPITVKYSDESIYNADNFLPINEFLTQLWFHIMRIQWQDL